MTILTDFELILVDCSGADNGENVDRNGSMYQQRQEDDRSSLSGSFSAYSDDSSYQFDDCDVKDKVLEDGDDDDAILVTGNEGSRWSAMRNLYRMLDAFNSTTATHLELVPSHQRPNSDHLMDALQRRLDRLAEIGGGPRKFLADDEENDIDSIARFRNQRRRRREQQQQNGSLENENEITLLEVHCYSLRRCRSHADGDQDCTFANDDDDFFDMEYCIPLRGAASML